MDNDPTDMFDLAAMKRRYSDLKEETHRLGLLIEAAEAYRATGESRAPTFRSVGSSQWTRSAHPARRLREQGKSVQSVTVDAALELIESTGRPTQTRDVIAAMLEKGLPLPERNVTNVVSARLSNSDKLEGKRGFGWWPKGRPWPHEEPAMFDDGAEAAKPG